MHYGKQSFTLQVKATGYSGFYDYDDVINTNANVLCEELVAHLIACKKAKLASRNCNIHLEKFLTFDLYYV